MTDHQTVGLQYAVTALGFLLVGFLLMLLMRWQLAWPASPLPGALAAVSAPVHRQSDSQRAARRGGRQ